MDFAQYRILICRVGEGPEERQVTSITDTFRAECPGRWLEAVFTKSPGVVVWCDDSFQVDNLPPNRLVPVAGGICAIGGTFLVSRVDAGGETRSLLDEDIAWVQQECPRVDYAALIAAGDESCGLDAYPEDGPEEEPEPDDGDGLHTYTTWELWVQEDGSVTGSYRSNDDNDDGVPDAEETVDDSFRWPSLAAALKVTGYCRTGCAGCAGCSVTVTVNGVSVVAPNTL